MMILEIPHTKKELALLMDKSGYIKENIKVRIPDIVGKDMDEFKDYLSERVTGTHLMMDTTYKVIDIFGYDGIVLEVTGNVANIVVKPRPNTMDIAEEIEKMVLETLNKEGYVIETRRDIMADIRDVLDKYI